MSRIILAIVIMVTAIFSQSTTILAQEINTAPCTLTPVKAARQLLHNKYYTPYFKQSDQKTVYYEGPTVLIYGTRDILVWLDYYPHLGTPFGRGRLGYGAAFMAACLDRPDVPHRWDLGQKCLGGEAAIARQTNSPKRYWRKSATYGVYRYDGPTLSFWVNQDAVLWKMQGKERVYFTVGYRITGKHLFYECNSYVLDNMTEEVVIIG